MPRPRITLPLAGLLVVLSGVAPVACLRAAEAGLPGDPGLGVREPGVIEPGVIEPGVSEPGVSEPGVIEPGVIEPGAPVSEIPRLGPPASAIPLPRFPMERAAGVRPIVAGRPALGDTVAAGQADSGPVGGGPVAGEQGAPASGDPVSADPADLCERAILNGARRGGVPVEVLHAVALTETGRKQDGKLRAWPWAINREGKGYWFDSYEEALAFAKQSLAEGRTSFDVGCVQINYRWHGHAFPSIEDMFNPEWTATYAAQFLRTLYEERGDWTAAAGAYHSLTPEKAQSYSARFRKLLAGPAAEGLTDAEALVAAVAPDMPGMTNRQQRRDAQRRAMAERIRMAEPMPATPGGVAGARLVQPGGALLSDGTPLFNQAQPLIPPARGPLF